MLLNKCLWTKINVYKINDIYLVSLDIRVVF